MARTESDKQVDQAEAVRIQPTVDLGQSAKETMAVLEPGAIMNRTGQAVAVAAPVAWARREQIQAPFQGLLISTPETQPQELAVQVLATQ